MKAGATCPLCGHRKAKRPCPGKDASICSVCCGTKRHVEVACPPDCTYLTGAHAAAWDGREDERRRDLMRLAPHVQALSETQAALFFYLVSGIVRVSAKHRDVDDAQWHDAILALEKTFATRESGLVYDHRADDWRAPALVRDMQEVLAPPESEGRAVAEPPLLIAALQAVAAAIAAARAENAGPRAFLETAVRVASRIASEDPAPSKPAAPRIVTP
jgi:hypothetical protein